MQNKKLILAATAAVLLVLFALGAMFYKGFEAKRISGMASSSDSSLVPFVRPYSPVKGNPDAKVTLTEFLDPECGSCRAFHPIVKDILQQYEGKLKVVIRYAAFHQNSSFAIKILEATRKQGKYWESLDALFQYQPNWSGHHNPRPEMIWQILPQVGVDIAQVKKDMESSEIADILKQDAKDLEQLNVRQTPTFFVNGKPLPSFGVQQLKNLIESEMQAAK